MVAITARGEATRQRIVAGAAQLLRDRGVANVRIDDVCAATGTGKSQVFHYFPKGKADLLVAAAEHEAEAVIADQLPYLDDLSSWQAWLSWRELVVQRYEELGRSCPLAVLTSQLDTPEVRDRIVNGVLSTWTTKVQVGIGSMQAKGLIDGDIDAGQGASAVVAGIYGGVVILLATGSTEHLRASLDGSLSLLGAPQ